MQTTRRLTDEEIREKQDLILEHLNLQADAETRKGNINKELNQEIDYHRKMVNGLRIELNLGEVDVDPQTKIPF